MTAAGSSLLTDAQDLPRRRDGAGRRRLILAIATRLFAQRPFDTVSTAEIAHEAGVAPSLVAYHFGSKRGLLIEVLRSSLAGLAQPLSPAGRDVTLDQTIAEFTDAWLSEIEDRHELWLALIESKDADAELESLREEITQRARAELVAYLSGRPPKSAPSELWAIAAAWQGLAQAIGVEWIKHKRITREQAKVIIVESLRPLLKLQGAVRRAGESPPPPGAAASSAAS